MVTCKTIKLLGTSSLVNSNKLLVYNSKTFSGSNRVANILGLSDYAIDILSAEPTITTINDILETLKEHEEFVILENLNKPEDAEKHFLFNNDNLNCISGEGFDTMIFLENDEILGYITLLLPLGNSTSTTKTRYKLNKTYLVRFIDIYVDSKNNGIRVDEDVIKLLDSLPSSVDEVEGFAMKKDIDIDIDSRYLYNNNYSYHINSQLKGLDSKDIFTDQIFLKETDGKYISSKLKLKKNINLGPDYSNFNHEQIGYYKGDPCLFIWNDNCEYSILSLTVFIDDLFKLSDLKFNKPKSYTYPRKDSKDKLISSTDIYKIPKVSERVESQKILYFSGRYIVVDADNTTYLFDVENQQGELSGENLYENNNGWIPIDPSLRSDEIIYYIQDDKGGWREITNIDNIINIKIYNNFNNVIDLEKEKVVGIRGGKKELSTSFIVDSLDPFNKLARLDSLTWQNYREAINKYYPFSNVYNNIEWCILSNTIPYRKIGEWIVYKNEYESTIIYSNMNKVVKFRSNEEEPIIVNDQVLLGRSGDKYILYDESGYFMSKAVSELTDLNEKEIFSKKYRVYDEQLDSKRFYTPTTPIDLQRSFLGSFRRNILPETLDGFKIIGSLFGVIYYRVGNIINFL